MHIGCRGRVFRAYTDDRCGSDRRTESAGLIDETVCSCSGWFAVAGRSWNCKTCMWAKLPVQLRASADRSVMRRLCDSIHSKVESVRLVFFLGDKRCHRERLCRCEHVEWWMLAWKVDVVLDDAEGWMVTTEAVVELRCGRRLTDCHDWRSLWLISCRCLKRLLLAACWQYEEISTTTSVHMSRFFTSDRINECAAGGAVVATHWLLVG